MIRKSNFHTNSYSRSERYQSSSAQPYQPIIVPTGGSSSRYRSHSESVQQTAQPQPIILPTQSTSSRYSSQQSSSSSSNIASQPVYIPSGPSGSSRYSSQSESYSNANRGGGYVPIPYAPSGGSSSSRYQSENAASSFGGFGADTGFGGRYSATGKWKFQARTRNSFLTVRSKVVSTQDSVDEPVLVCLDHKPAMIWVNICPNRNDWPGNKHKMFKELERTVEVL